MRSHWLDDVKNKVNEIRPTLAVASWGEPWQAAASRTSRDELGQPVPAWPVLCVHVPFGWQN